MKCLLWRSRWPRRDYRWCLEAEAAATAGINHHPHVCQPLFLSRHGNLLVMGMLPPGHDWAASPAT